MAPEDYFSSGLRHFEESKDLHERGRLDSAAYLAGYAIECSLKKLLELQRGPSGKAYGHDVQGMSGKALALAALLAPASARYRVDTIPALPQAMDYWSPALRYRTSGDVNKDIADTMIEAATETVKMVLVPLLLDGLEAAIR